VAKRKGVNVSAAIRDYLKEHGDEGPKAAAAAISKQLGKTISPTYVSNVKSLMKGKGGGGKKRGPKPGRKKQMASGVAANGSVDLLTLEAVKEIVRRVGAENAKRLIDILA
jgi:hypothetical protein